MEWNTFDSDRATLEKQYDRNNWIIASGLSVEELSAQCYRLIQLNRNLSHLELKANLFCYILENAQIEINPIDFFAEKINHGGILLNLRKEWLYDIKHKYLEKIILENETPGSIHDFESEKNLHKPLDASILISPWQTTAESRNQSELHQALSGRAFNAFPDFSHAAPSWEDIFSLGVSGLLTRLKNEYNKKLASDSLDEMQEIYYASTEKVYMAFITLLKRFSHEAKKIYCETMNDRMLLLSQTFENLSKYPPQTFIEALQLSILYYTILTFIEGVGIRSLGCIDKLFYSYYKHDLESGRYTKEQLKEILKYYFIKFHSMKIVANTPFSICGFNRDGSSYYNEFSDFIIDVYRTMNINDPKIQVLYTPDLPATFTKKILSTIVNGNNSIVFINSQVVVSGLTKIGISLEDARDFIEIGCYESSAQGTELPCTCAGRINTAKIVELAINSGIDMTTGEKLSNDYGKPETWTSLYEIFIKILNELATRVTNIINGYERYYSEINPSPFFSATFQNSVETGIDVYAGGAKYNNTSINAFSIADTVDSLIVMKKAVYENKDIPFDTLLSALRVDWNNNELLRLKVKRNYPKYGNGIAEVDLLSDQIVKEISRAIQGKKNSRGGTYRCGLFSIDASEFFGKATSALPNGRHAQEMLSKNMCPVVGEDKKGITAVINSVTKIDYSTSPNGTVLDVTLHKSTVAGDDGLNSLFAVLKTYMVLGGYAIHFNVLDPDILRDAQKHPEAYSSLQIRLCGWNVYFVDLNEEEQNDFIKRSEHAISI